MITAMKARQVEHARLQAEDMGLRLEFGVDVIEVHVADSKKYPGFVEDARLFSTTSVEELKGWMNGWGMGWTYTGLSKQQEVEEVPELTDHMKEAVATWLDALEDMMDDLCTDEPFTREDLLVALKVAAKEKR